MTSIVPSISRLVPYMDNWTVCPPPTVSTLGYFLSRRFLDYWGCLVRGEPDFVKFWVKFDQNNAQEGRPKFDILKVRRLMLMVK